MEKIVEIEFKRKNGVSLYLNTILFVAIAIIIDRTTAIDGKIIIISTTIITFLLFIWNLHIIKIYRNELIIKRPLIPFGFGNKRFDIREIDEIKFHRNRKGLIVTIISKENRTSLSIDYKKEEIEDHCAKLSEIGIFTINEI